MADQLPLPAGYARATVHGATVVARDDALDAVCAAVRDGRTLHAWAASRPDRRELRGRAAAWAVALPGGAGDVVVRHSWHGGLLAPLTRDLFVAPSRAPRELATSHALRAAGVCTPEVVAYVLYPAGGPLCRADVATRLVHGARDLPVAIAALPPRATDEPAPWVRPVGTLLHALGRLGARHPDLNLKNVLLVPRTPGDDDEAWVLDLDVVRIASVSESEARGVAQANYDRLARSLVKWRERRGLKVSQLDLAFLRAYALRGPEARLSVVWTPGHNHYDPS